MQSMNKLIERQTPRQMSLNSTCIQLHFILEIMQNRTEQSFLFQNRSRTTRRWYYMGEKSKHQNFSKTTSEKNIFAVDVHALGQNATAGMQQAKDTVLSQLRYL